jgi:prepilin-type N-terminal cleavage/methylation domain-containing protein
MKLQQKAFTLVELIVVITILAILWTIAFISLQWYSKASRDSVRVADISSMKTSLELFHLNAGKYPQPTLWETITYSGWEVRTQWTFWDTVVSNLSRNLNKIPTDPLTNKEYIYSRLNTKNEYEIWGILEWDLALNTISQSYAATTPVKSYIVWTYNWLVAKISTGSTTYVLALPTIISSDLWDKQLTWIISRQALAYNWYDNIWEWLGNYTSTGWFTYLPTNLVVYEWDISNLSWSLLKDFADNLQLAYTWSDISSSWIYASILLLNTSDTAALNILAGNIVNNQLGGDINVNNSIIQEEVVSWPSIIKLSAWPRHTCVIYEDWSVKCWGRNNLWQLWDWTTINSATAIDSIKIPNTVTDIQNWDYHTCILLSTWKVQCWGVNSSWELWNWSVNPQYNPYNTTWLNSWVTHLSTGLYRMNCAIQSWIAKCWGYNNEWQVWNGSSWNNVLSPALVSIATVSEIAWWQYHTCAITQASEVKCWGLNGYWQLWSWNNTSYIIPHLVTGLTWPFNKIYVWFWHSCILHTDWSVKCWGLNTSWQLWDNSFTNKNYPVQVTGLTSWVVELSLWWNHTCALLDDWSMKCWGKNNHWQLWDETVINKNTPTQVTWLTNWVVNSISLWTDHSCALLTDWWVKCWGYNLSNITLWSSIAIETPNPTPLNVDWL